MTGYEEIILDHWRHPRNKGRLPDATGSAVEANPLCGDIVRMEVKVADGVVAAARFTGEGCAISLASASLLTELITGKPVAEVEKLTDEDLLSALGGVVKTRLSCALLPLGALRRALAAEDSSRRTLPPSEV
ncbi:iron-sulfur cluster assembly scaffold protein [Candidatus Bipolaricaulota bacterium]|nr:iron-sulfur cluster assembly scaffold protein [Candidatus Bipolaricaulota bacterium]